MASLLVTAVDIDLATMIVFARGSTHGFWSVIVADRVDPADSHTLGEQQANSAKLQQWCTASQANRDKCNGK